MAVKVGKIADVDVSGTKCTLIGSWSLSYDTDALEITGFTSSGSREYTAGLQGATGSLSGYVDWSGSQLPIKTHFLAGTTVVLKLYENGSKYWQATALFTNLTENASVDGLVTIDAAFTATGAVSYN